MEWWVWTALAVLVVLGYYLAWLGARVGRLHRRAESATAALDASLVRRAAAAALLGDALAGEQPRLAAGLSTAVRAALAATGADREVAENDLTQVLREVPERVPRLVAEAGPVPASGWAAVVTASRRVGLARQVHTDQVRDARAVRRRVPVRLLRLARRFPEPLYFDMGDPSLDDLDDTTARPADRAGR